MPGRPFGSGRVICCADARMTARKLLEENSAASYICRADVTGPNMRRKARKANEIFSD
jgi:hypothetical protein